MRERFYALAADALERDERVAIVLAEIGVAQLPPHPRVFNVGIREQLMIGVAAGLALERYRPIVHSYAPFLVERPFEQLKLDLGHQDVGAVLVGTGASYDASESGRTHQAPEDVPLLSTLPGWTIDVPGHPAELDPVLDDALAGHHRAYVRLTDEANAAARDGRQLRIVRRGGDGAPFVLAVGPSLDQALAATAGEDATVAYLTRVGPFPHAALRAAVRSQEVVLVEPYLAGTSAAHVADALRDRPHRLLALGIRDPELRRYGTPADHRAAHGLDAEGIGRSLAAWCGDPTLAAA